MKDRGIKNWIGNRVRIRINPIKYSPPTKGWDKYGISTLTRMH